MSETNYVLMHKNIPVTSVNIDESTGNIAAINELITPEHLPIGVHVDNSLVDRRELNQWWIDRSIPASRSGLRDLLYAMRIDSPKMLLTRSMGLSLSDQYWVKPAGQDVSWEVINFFENDFSEDMGNLLMGDIHPDESLNLCSPDNTLDGCLNKRWKIINGQRCLIKAGEPPFYQQPINEMIASRLMERLNVPHVSYSVIWKKEKPYSVCGDFITPETELVSAHRVMSSKQHTNNQNSYMHYVSVCEENGIKDIKQSLDKMLVVDYIMLNEDRHFNNFGIIRNADTLEWLDAAPIYDTGSSLGWNKLSSKLSKEVTCKPFKKTHDDQLKLVASFDWIDFSQLKDFDAEVYEILSDPNTASYIDGSRRKAITELLQNNIRKLENTAFARAKSITKKAYPDCTIKSQPDYDETLTDLQKF